MKTVIECVPNISEGRDLARVEEIAAAVRAAPGARLLDVSSDASHNRSVLTLVGDEDGVRAAVRALFEAALPRIDLTRHAGEHPRMGAVDVVPFIPIRGATVEQCVALSRRVGEEIAASDSEFRSICTRTRPRRNAGATSRRSARGSSRDLPPRWPHPSGSPTSVRTGRTRPPGVVAVGARAPLIAYNINLGTKDLSVADRIAKSIRHIGGGFRYVKAMGVALADRGQVQVSINMTNYKKTPLHRVFECVRSEAERYGVAIVGSEIVGLTPAEALFMAAEHYLRIENFSGDLVLENRLMDDL